MNGNRTCSVDGCSTTTGRFVAGMCNRHYLRKWKYGSTTTPTQQARLDRLADPPVCVIDGCKNTVFVQKCGLCGSHYARKLTYGDPLFVPLGARALPDACRKVGCKRKPMLTGWCKMHQTRIDKWGAPGPVLAENEQTIEERVFCRVALGSTMYAGTPCVVWTGTITNTGYGEVVYKGKRMLVHRWSWEHFIGPIPKGLVVDHLCLNQACCNVAHLEPVTSRENTKRYWQAVGDGRQVPYPRGDARCCCGRHVGLPHALDALASLGT